MQPDIPLLALLGGQLVVLAVVASHQNTQPCGGSELAGFGGTLEPRLLFAPLADVATVGQLRADIVEVLLALRLLQFLHHALQIPQLLPALGQLLGQHLLGGLGLGILLEVPGGILLRGQAHIQRDVHSGTPLLIVILRGQLSLPPLHAVKIGSD